MPKLKYGIGIFFLFLIFFIVVFGKMNESIFDAVIIGMSFILMIRYSFSFGGFILVSGFFIKLISYGDYSNVMSELSEYIVFLSIFYFATTVFEKNKRKIRDNYLIAEKISLGVAVMDEKMNYIYVNQSYAELRGSYRSEIEGKNFKKYWHKEKEQKELYEWIEDNIKSKSEWSGDILSKGKDGKEYWEEVYIFPVEVEKNKFEYIIFAKNITYRVEMEKKVIELKRKAQEASYEKSRFLANMSHDIRTPVNGIIGFADLLVDMEQDTEKLEMLNIIKNSSELLIMLINDILDLSKIEAGKIKINYEEVEIERFIKMVASKFEKMIEIKGVNFILEFDPKIYKSLFLDRVRVEQVLMNLLGNAMKFTEKGDISVKVYKISENEKSEKIRFEVKDSGTGIPKEKLDIIFEEFTQANEEIVKKYGGTGLGLAISKKLVDKMGGRLNVESIVNKGSKFYFDLELKKGNCYEFKIFKKNKKELNIVILTEDDEAKILNERFKGANVFFKNIRDKNGVFEELKSEKCDVLFIDIEKDENEKIKILNEIKSEIEEEIIFAYKDYATESDVEKLKQLGFRDFISREWGKEDIFRVVEKNRLG